VLDQIDSEVGNVKKFENYYLEWSVSDQFSPLTAPLPLHGLPLYAPLTHQKQASIHHFISDIIMSTEKHTNTHKNTQTYE